MVIGVIERDGGTMYCSVWFFGPEGACLARIIQLLPRSRRYPDPNFEGETILKTSIDRSQILRGKFDLDVVGHYGRPDIFQLEVDERGKRPVKFACQGWAAGNDQV
jgi:hypothetical protein